MEYLIYLNNVPIHRISGDDVAGAISADMCSLADLFHCSAAICNASNNMILDYHKKKKKNDDIHYYYENYCNYSLRG